MTNLQLQTILHKCLVLVSMCQVPQSTLHGWVIIKVASINVMHWSIIYISVQLCSNKERDQDCIGIPQSLKGTRWVFTDQISDHICVWKLNLSGRFLRPALYCLYRVSPDDRLWQGSVIEGLLDTGKLEKQNKKGKDMNKT